MLSLIPCVNLELKYLGMAMAWVLLVYSVVPAFLNDVNKGHGPAYNNQASLPVYDLGVFYAHENTKKRRKNSWTCFAVCFVFQSRMCPVLGFQWHKLICVSLMTCCQASISVLCFV